MRSILRSPLGFSMVEVMVSMGLLSMLALGMFSMQTAMNQSKNQANNAAQSDQFRRQIEAMLQNPTAWKNTLKNNGTGKTFACIIAGTDCTNAKYNGPPTTASVVTDYSAINFQNTIPGGAFTCNHASAIAATGSNCYGGFDVYDVSGSVYYNMATDSTAGFQFNGKPCAAGISDGLANAAAIGFQGGGTAGSKAVSVTGTAAKASFCPFRLVLWWVPICSSTNLACTYPNINVKGYLVYAPNPNDPYAKGAPKPANYGVNLILPPRFN